MSGGAETAAVADLLELLDHHAVVDGNRPGIVDGRRTVTFAETVELTRCVHDDLRDAGVEPGAVVGLEVGRSLDHLVALLGILRSGCAFLPLDRRLPPDRLRTAVAEARCELIIRAGTGTTGWSDVSTVPTVPLRTRTGRGLDATTAAPERVGDDQSAYVLFTSGSTGAPKGVAVTHGNLRYLYDALSRTILDGAGPARIAVNASLSFDASVQQWCRIFRGDTLYVVDERMRTNPARLVDWLERHEITDIDFTPTHVGLTLAALSARYCPDRVLVGGEPIPQALWDELSRLSAQRGVSIWNMYGPTECTVDATAARVAGGTPHIGSPLPGAWCAVLDAEGNVVEDGAVGELHIGGAGVARGYVGAAGRGDDRFLDQVSSGAGRVYRTGDYVRRAGPVLEYVGRRDRQVKIAGHRIELAEVERAVGELAEVRRAVAFPVNEPGGETGLVVAVEPAAPRVDLDRLISTVVLPPYARPSEVLPVMAWPLNNSGKVDEAALRAMLVRSDSRDVMRIDPERVREAWCFALERPDLGDGADFFELGGDSHAATRLLAHCRQHFGARLSMRDIFNNPSIEDFRRLLLERRPDTPRSTPPRPRK